jgi:hypothetical protein
MQFGRSICTCNQETRPSEFVFLDIQMPKKIVEFFKYFEVIKFEVVFITT